MFLAVELATLTTYAQREVAWAYPGFFDQTVHLTDAYQISQDFAAHGIPKATRQHFARPHATGVLLPLQGAVHGVVLGPGRLAALSVNFLHFALFQCALVGTLLWLSRSWWVSLAGFGLTLALKSVFQPAGGLLDFRIDFASFCLFGVFLCALVRSRLLLNHRWAVGVGLAATVLVLVRFITAVYLGGILGLLGVSFALRRLRASDAEARKQARKRLRGWLIATGILVLGTWPVLISQRKAIESYYVVGHIQSSEKDIRAAEFGVTEWRNAALFYPRSIYDAHTGVMFWAVAGLLLAAGVLARARRGESAEAGASAVRLVLPVAALGFVVPFAVLNVSAMKSPVVGVIHLPAILLAVLAPMVAAAANARAGVLRAAAVISIACGFLTQLNFAAAPGFYRTFNDDTAQTMRALEDLINAAERKGHASPEVFVDTNSHEFIAQVLQVVEFEKHGRLRAYRDGGMSVFAGSEEEHFQRLLRADVVILAGRPVGLPKYPYDETLERMRPRVQAYCDANLIKVGEYQIAARTVTTYIRGRLRVEGVSADGWVTDRGVRLVGTLADLKHCRRIEFRPEWKTNHHGRTPGVTAEANIGDRAPQKLVASMAEDFSAVRVEWRPADLPPGTPVAIHIRFDSAFVPRDKGFGQDSRSLVMYLGKYPQSRLLTAHE